MTNIVFETSRTIARLWKETDITSIIKVYGDIDAMKWVGDGSAISEEEAMQWMTVTQNNYQKRGYGMLAVELKEEPGVIGFCGLVHPGNQAEPEAKYAYLRKHWGKGIATEVLIELLNYGVKQHNLKQIIATIAPENIASEKVLLKVGMKKDKLVKEDDEWNQYLIFEG